MPTSTVVFVIWFAVFAALFFLQRKILSGFVFFPYIAGFLLSWFGFLFGLQFFFEVGFIAGLMMISGPIAALTLNFMGEVYDEGETRVAVGVTIGVLAILCLVHGYGFLNAYRTSQFDLSIRATMRALDSYDRYRTEVPDTPTFRVLPDTFVILDTFNSMSGDFQMSSYSKTYGGTSSQSQVKYVIALVTSSAHVRSYSPGGSDAQWVVSGYVVDIAERKVAATTTFYGSAPRDRSGGPAGIGLPVKGRMPYKEIEDWLTKIIE